ncbi:hypothetical protein ALMP_72460 [Streptomyces sp. A012304]|nr:hypothetical protein ALMP_72460 [Streptomyces sp. A012304]
MTGWLPSWWPGPSPGGVKLTGGGGLLQQLTKRVLESALEGELTDHLGHEPGERAEGGRENYRNGHRSKTVLTEAGPVAIAVPRDRAGSFEPQLVKKRQRRLGGVDEMVLSLSAKGLTRGEISAHLAEVYGAEVSKSTISPITDSVMAGMTEWQNRPLTASTRSSSSTAWSPTGPSARRSRSRRGTPGHPGSVDRRRRGGREVLAPGPDPRSRTAARPMS